MIMILIYTNLLHHVVYYPPGPRITIRTSTLTSILPGTLIPLLTGFTIDHQFHSTIDQITSPGDWSCLRHKNSFSHSISTIVVHHQM